MVGMDMVGWVVWGCEGGWGNRGGWGRWGQRLGEMVVGMKVVKGAMVVKDGDGWGWKRSW